MSVKTLPIASFLEQSGPILDVRSPAEFLQGHIPGAVNLPLFDDQERAQVGTVYKKEGKSQAIELGLQLVGPKLVNYVKLAQMHAKAGSARVHCWRGGMRSSSMAMLLNTIGVPTFTLEGGYKSFRRWGQKLFSTSFKYAVLGGLTGCGKTSILQELKNRGKQVLDLESLANHRGSAFGSLQMPPQPSTEQFHNLIALQLGSFSADKIVWVEDESRMIGLCHIPEVLFFNIKKAPLFLIECPLKERVERLVSIYGCSNTQDLINATQRISKKLGGSKTKEIINSISDGHMDAAVESILQYYDAAYLHALTKRQKQYTHLYGENWSPAQWADELARERYF